MSETFEFESCEVELLSDVLSELDGVEEDCDVESLVDTGTPSSTVATLVLVTDPSPSAAYTGDRHGASVVAIRQRVSIIADAFFAKVFFRKLMLFSPF